MSSVSEPEANSTSKDSENLRWKECFLSATQYFTDQLDSRIDDHTEEGTHPERPTTARDYFEERGWTEETIKTHHLGWVPPESENNLVSHLEERGFTEAEILATGLFTENLEPLWNGRYVFPYFNEDNRPVYAISRATGEDGHPDDFLASKYAKAAHTKDYSRISEPIFGLRTVCDGEPVIITEGMADAITVQQAGYPCVSPVTTQFSKSARSKLLTRLEEHEVPKVYVLQDAELPGARPNEKGDRLDIEQFGAGVEGAVRTASYLSENGIETRVNTPPRPNRKKVDLDDYLREGWGTLEALLRSAKPPEHHAAYSESESRRSAPAESSLPEPGDSKNRSALFNLKLTEITGLYEDDRGKNPLGHKGESEDYFIVTDHDTAYDHKRKATYKPLTYLLCQAGERPVDDPEGSLSDRENLIAWKHAKGQGLLPENDPIPHRALIHVAVKHELCTRDEISDGWRLPKAAYKMVLEVVAEEYGLDPGRQPYEYQTWSDGLSSEPQVTNSNSNGSELTLAGVRNRTSATIDQALTRSQNPLIDALPAAGKSYGIIEWEAKSKTPLTVLTPRNKLHDENEKRCAKFGLSKKRLPAFTRHCGCATGDYGGDWKENVRALYEAGATGREIHEFAEKQFGQPLPCQRDGQCEYIRKWNFDPDDYDVLLGNHRHAYQGTITENRVVAFDETPSDAFLIQFEPPEVVRVVTQYLKQKSGIPYKNYNDLVENRSDQYRYDDTLEWFVENNPDVSRNGYEVMIDQGGLANAYAPLLTYALLVGEDLGNEWEHATLPNDRIAARNRNPKEGHDESELTLLIPPLLEDVENVIGLDGTPWVRKWELALGTPMNESPVLNEEERAQYINNVLNLSIYQMSTASEPYSSGKWIKPNRDRDFIEQIGEIERQQPDLITSQSAINEYESLGMMDYVRKYTYYGDFKGSNIFEHSRLAAIIGSTHYGGTYLKMWGAFEGEPIERQGDGRGMNLDYNHFGNQALHDMREGEVLQALMRFGRDGEGSTIYVLTAAIPDWVPLAGTGTVKKWSDGMKELLREIRGSDEWGTTDLLDGDRKLDIDNSDAIGERQVRRHLDTLHDLGFLERRKDGNGWVWENVGLEDVHQERQVLFEE